MIWILELWDNTTAIIFFVNQWIKWWGSSHIIFASYNQKSISSLTRNHVLKDINTGMRYTYRIWLESWDNNDVLPSFIVNSSNLKQAFRCSTLNSWVDKEQFHKVVFLTWKHLTILVDDRLIPETAARIRNWSVTLSSKYSGCFSFPFFQLCNFIIMIDFYFFLNLGWSILLLMW